MSAGLTAAWTSRRCGLGGGSIIAGRVALAIRPDVLQQLAADRRVVLVSGTNGKTTTSHLLAGALRVAGPVAHNAAGSNMADGAVAALAAQRHARSAVLEVDELHLPEVADAVEPAVVVLLNLTRDQLDRVAEVHTTAGNIGSALARHPRTTVVANADDPLTVWAAQAARRRVWVAPGGGWHDDSASCPRCDELLSRSGAAGRRWWCQHCGLTRPEPDWWWEDEDPPVVHHARSPGRGWSARFRIGLPGRVNRGNAVIAAAAAESLGVEPERAIDGLGGVREVAGRYSRVATGSHVLRLLLVKNPAGWAEALDVLADGRPLLFVINAREADGRDVSWLWDVPVGMLAGRSIAVAGQRGADLGLRLSYAEIDHHSRTDPLEALAMLPPGEVDVVANYTAFHQLYRALVPAT